MNASSMIRNAAVARKKLRQFGGGQALSARSALDLRAGALARLRSTSIVREVKADNVAAKAAVARAQLRKG